MSLALRVTQPAPASSEHDLVAAVRRGDDRAFEELYARYRSRIGSYIFGMVGDHGRAEDIAQEVFISALRRIRENERTIIFKPWIYEIAKNACIDEFRRTRRVHEVPLEPDDDREFPAAAMPSTSPTPEVAVESKQRLTDLKGAFRGLSESHHRILVLRELEGLSYNQIGARLGMTKPVVESTLFRARRRLGEEFEELESGRRCARVQSQIASAGERPLRSLGIRDRRQFARHVAHCESCRRQARDAGIDESLYRAKNLLGRIAVLAPVPWLRSVAPYVEPTRSGSGLGRAVATAAVVVAGAGAGGGLVSDMTGSASRPPSAVLAAPLPPVRDATTPASAAAAARPPARGANRSGAVPTAGVVALRKAQSNPPSRGGGAGTTHVLGLRNSRAQSHAQNSAAGPTPGAATGRPRAGGSPADVAGSEGSQTSQPGGGASQPAAPSGSSGGATPGVAAGPSLGQTGAGAVDAVNDGVDSLPLTPGSLPGVMPGASTQIRSLPELPLNGGGSAAPAVSGPSSSSSPAQPSGSGATTSSPPPLNVIGPAGAAPPSLGPSQSP